MKLSQLVVEKGFSAEQFAAEIAYYGDKTDLTQERQFTDDTRRVRNITDVAINCAGEKLIFSTHSDQPIIFGNREGETTNFWTVRKIVDGREMEIERSIRDTRYSNTYSGRNKVYVAWSDTVTWKPW